MKLRFLIVGSTLHSDEPGDLDLLGVMSRREFLKEFGFTWSELNRLWNKPKSGLYKAKCRGASIILEQFFNKRHIDFKFVPDNMPYGDTKEIELLDLPSVD